MSTLQWRLPHDLLAHSIQIMAPHGARGNEGLALWFGVGDQREARVTHVVELSGPGFNSRPLFMSLSLATMAALTELADRLGVYLLGQIHSHPGYFTDLSDLDEAHGIRTPDYLSVVCPHYAQQQGTDWSQCGVHVFEGDRYRRLSRAEISDRIAGCDEPIIPLQCGAPA
jgi:hypothetical protein